MTPKLNCVDMSKWGGELTAAEVACMKSHGVRRVIVGTGNMGPGGLGEWSRQQADAAIKGGMDLDAYVYLYMGGSPEGQIQAGLNTMKDIPVGTWWLDAEDTQSPEANAHWRTVFLERCISYLNGQRITSIGIYTGRWWWVPKMQNSRAFKFLPLWNSYFDGDPDTDGLPYGGWTDSAIEQYQGTTDLCGHSVDLNYDKRYAIIPEPPEEEPMPTDDELKAALKRIGWADDVGPTDNRLRSIELDRYWLAGVAFDPDANRVQEAVRILKETEGFK